MNCMKCGRELREGNAFCDECLKDMERDPVRIDAPVVIPAQPPVNPNSYRRPLINPDEEIERLRKANQNLILAFALALVTALLLGGLLYYNEIVAVVEKLGQNYSVIETATGAMGH